MAGRAGEHGVEDPGGDSSYKHAGWTFKIDQGDEGSEFKILEVDRVKLFFAGG